MGSADQVSDDGQDAEEPVPLTLVMLRDPDGVVMELIRTSH